MDWLEDAVGVYENDTENPASENVAYLLKRTIEFAIPTKSGYTLHPITQAERTVVIDVLNEWHEITLEATND